MKIIEAISRFRAGGYDEALGFTVYDTLRYREALEPLVAEEVRTRLARSSVEFWIACSACFNWFCTAWRLIDRR